MHINQIPKLPAWLLADLAPLFGSPTRQWSPLNSTGIKFMLAMQSNECFVGDDNTVPLESYGDLAQANEGAEAWNIPRDAVEAIEGLWSTVDAEYDPLSSDFSAFGIPAELTDAMSWGTLYHGDYLVLHGGDGEMYGYYWLLRKVK